MKIVKEKTRWFNFYSRDEVEEFIDNLVGYKAKSYFDLTSKYMVILKKQKGLFQKYYIPDLTRDQEMFDNYSKAINILKDNLGSSRTEDKALNKVIKIIKNTMLESADR